MRSAAVRASAFGLFGVIAGFALREVLVAVVPLLADDSSKVAPWAQILESCRGVVVAVVLIRFYLGAISYFRPYLQEENRGNSGNVMLVLVDRPYPVDYSNLVQEKEEDETELEPNPIFFGLDFLIGIFHFMLIFAWARTITDLSRPHSLETGHFLIVGAFVLLYDWIWFAVCFRNVTGPKIGLGALLNTGTVLVSVAFFVVCLAWGQDAVFREQASIMPVIVISIIVIADLINSKSRIRDFLMGLLRSAGPAPKDRSSS